MIHISLIPLLFLIAIGLIIIAMLMYLGSQLG